jgi:hypothetical protein
MGIELKPIRTPPYVKPQQQVPTQELGLGSRGHFWGNAAEQWEPTIKVLDTIWTTRGTIPVPREAYFPRDVNFVTEGGRSNQAAVGVLGSAGDEYLRSFGFGLDKDGNPDPEKLPSKNLGIYSNVDHDRFEGKSRVNVDARKHGYPEPFLIDDRTDRPTLAITDLGWEQLQPMKPLIKANTTKFNKLTQSPYTTQPPVSTGIHEIAHYLDSIIGLGAWQHGSELMDSHQIESTNHPYHQGEQNWNKDTLYDAWMNDPRTKHLDLNNPENTGLRELLHNRGHHGGVVNPREGFGKYIATALTDPGYNKKNKPSWRVSQKTSDYKMQPSEKFARLSSHTLRPQSYDDGFTAMTPELDKTFADSLATFLNSEYLINQRE